jgi:CHAT domain-containing protein
MCLSRAHVAVLSACQTGLGESVGAGVIGLARAFQIAGVSDVVMSLWNINDAATRDLMIAFIRNIQNGVTPPKALRNAMIEARKQYPADEYWASFTIFSEGLH